MGVPVDDCRPVGKLLGLKLFVNEFVAFSEMADLIENRKAYDEYYCQHVYPTNATDLIGQQFNNGSWYLPDTGDVIGPFMSVSS